MGKTLDERIVEYAYVDKIFVHNNIFPSIENIEQEDGTVLTSSVLKTEIILTIKYDTQDSEHNKLGERNISHKLYSGNESKSILEINQLINDNLEILVNQDKQDISGYVSPI